MKMKNARFYFSFGKTENLQFLHELNNTQRRTGKNQCAEIQFIHFSQWNGTQTEDIFNKSSDTHYISAKLLHNPHYMALIEVEKSARVGDANFFSLWMK